MIARAVGVTAGVWLMAAPAVLGHAGTPAEISDRTLGPIIAAVSFIAAWGVVRALRWTALPLAAWCVYAPWFLDFPATAAVSNLVVGLALAVTAFTGGGVQRRFGGGWRSLLAR